MAAAENPLPILGQIAQREDSRTTVLKHAANELVFGVVGHVGSGTTEIARALHDILGDQTLPGGAFETEALKARDVIQQWAVENGRALSPEGDRSLDATERLQDYGDEMRSRQTTSGDPDYTAVARALILKVRATRAHHIGASRENVPVPPDGKRRAYILDSLRHPAEVELLRHVYQDAFVLIGVVCEARKRLDRIARNTRTLDTSEPKLS